MLSPAKWFSVLIALVVFAGCQRADPRFEPVTAASPSAFSRWRSMASDRIKAPEWREFDAVLQEIRLRVTAEKQASGSEAVEAAMRSRIDGLLFRDVLILGHEAKLQRIEPERSEVQLAMQVNIRRASFERGTESGADIERIRERQEKRLKDLDAQIAAAKARIAELKQMRPGDTQ
jgi:hypothetical protein